MKVKKFMIIFAIVGMLVLVLFVVGEFILHPFHRVKSHFTQDEIITIYREHEEAFEYVKDKLLSLTYDRAFCVGITKLGNHVGFYSPTVPIEHLDVGYQKDEKFEEYLRLLLVELKLGDIYYVRHYPGTLSMQFGSYERIVYCEGDIPPNLEDSSYSGRLNGNWFFEIFIPE